MNNVIGLNDIDGNQVYDGCILKYAGYRLEVCYDKKKFMWIVKDVGAGNFARRALHEIVGHIFYVVKPITKEDMIVYWDAKGNSLARVIFEDGEDLEKAEEHLYPAMMDVFGKDEQCEHIIDNSSYEYYTEWE